MLHTAITADPLDKLARDILAGEWATVPDPEEYYSNEEWTDAAQYAVDCDDYGELRFMAKQAGAHADWSRLPEHLQDNWCGFGNFAAKWPASAGHDGGNFDAGAFHPDAGGAL